MPKRVLNPAQIIIEFKDDGSGLNHIVQSKKTFYTDADGESLGAPKIEDVAIDSETLSSIVGESLTSIAEQVKTLNETIATKTKEIEEKDKTIKDSTSTIEGLNSQITALQKQIEDLQNKPVDPPVSTVPKMSRLQARLVLAQFGKLDVITYAINELSASDPARIYFENATEWFRDNPILNQMAPAFGITEEQLDQMFEIGPTLGV